MVIRSRLISLSAFLSLIFLLVFCTYCNSYVEEASSDKHGLYINYKLLHKEDAIKEFKKFRISLFDIHPGLTDSLFTNEAGLYFDSLQNEIKQDITDVAFFKLLMLGVDKIGCSHTYVEFPDNIRENLNKFEQAIFLPLSVYYSQGKYYTASVDTLIKNAELVSINGNSINHIYDRLKKYSGNDGNNPCIDSAEVEEDFYFK